MMNRGNEKTMANANTLNIIDSFDRFTFPDVIRYGAFDESKKQQ